MGCAAGAVLACLACEPPQPARRSLQVAPELTAVAEAGRATAQRASQRGINYRVTYEGRGGALVLVDVALAAAQRSWRLSVRTAQGENIDLGQVTEQHGAWVAEQPEAGRSRQPPWGTPFQIASFPRWILAATGQPLTDTAELRTWTHDETRGDIAAFLGPAEPEPPADLWQALDEVDALVLRGRAGAAWSLAEAVRAARRGARRFIHLPSGLMFRARGWPRAVAVTDAAVAENAVTDAPAPAAPGAGSDMVMFSASAMWTPGSASEVDARILDLVSGSVRRPPVEGAFIHVGCFSADRRKVYVPVEDVVGGITRLMEVDLATGAARRLAASLAPALVYGPRLAPDGRRLAVLHKPVRGERARMHQVLVVDLSTDDVVAVGEPANVGTPEWLPDGSGFLITCFGAVGGDSHVCRLGLDGTLSQLVEGSAPLVLGPDRGMIFQDPDDTWQQAALDGSGARTLGSGFPAHGFPALSPDGQRLMMVRFGGSGVAPKPVIIDLETLSTTDVAVPAGLWTTPAWR